MEGIVIKEETPPVYKKLHPDDMSFEMARSSGPGGQNVNKRSTKVWLRLHLQKSVYFTDEEKEKIRRAYPNKINQEGDFIISSQISRSQKTNKEDAFQRAEMMINKALAPRAERVETKVPPSQKKERLREKGIISEKKKMRKDWREERYL